MHTSLLLLFISAFVFVHSTVTPAPTPCPERTVFNRLIPSQSSLSVGDGPVTLGLRFYSEVPGKVTSVSFYKSAGDNSIIHQAALWDDNGALVASGNNGSEPASGWVNYKLPYNTRITPAYSVWTVGVRMYDRFYTYQHNYFAPNVDASPLHGINGVYAYGPFQTGGEVPVNAPVPAQEYLGSNYWIDVGFTPSSPCPSFAPCV